MHIEERLSQYARVGLTVDLSPLNESERNIIPLLIEAARAGRFLLDTGPWGTLSK